MRQEAEERMSKLRLLKWKKQLIGGVLCPKAAQCVKTPVYLGLGAR